MADRKRTRVEDLTTSELTIPGFIDIQINGWGGVDFSSDTLTEPQVKTAFRDIISSGTCMFLPTVITASMKTFGHVLPLLVKVAALPEFEGRIPGLHLEGPFISSQPGARGCHPAEHVQIPNIETLNKMMELSKKKIILLTIAADTPNAEELTRAAVAMGITVSLGHHLATAEQLANLAKAGATLLTHLGNGMPNMVHRHNNPLTAGLANDDLAASFITDGFHLPPDVLKIAFRVKSIEKIVVVSDAMCFGGLAAGTYPWMGKDILVAKEEKGYVIRDAKENCLAGSAATMLQCMNHLWAQGLCTLDELEKVSFHNPLRLLGLKVDSKLSRQVSYNSQTGFQIL
eukprot:m.16240 g.16240  ORF g.16240 m.16240 type:complete len:344 (-) comp10946_c0_seq1:56-1087(-)